MLWLLQTVAPKALAARLAELADDPLATAVTTRAISTLHEYGRDPASPLATLAARAVGPLDDPDTVTQSLVALVDEVLAELPPIGGSI